MKLPTPDPTKGQKVKIHKGAHLTIWRHKDCRVEDGQTELMYFTLVGYTIPETLIKRPKGHLVFLPKLYNKGRDESLEDKYDWREIPENYAYYTVPADDEHVEVMRDSLLQGERIDVQIFLEYIGKERDADEVDFEAYDYLTRLNKAVGGHMRRRDMTPGRLELEDS
jgi:hypothetical protein